MHQEIEQDFEGIKEDVLHEKCSLICQLASCKSFMTIEQVDDWVSKEHACICCITLYIAYR